MQYFPSRVNAAGPGRLVGFTLRSGRYSIDAARGRRREALGDQRAVAEARLRARQSGDARQPAGERLPRAGEERTRDPRTAAGRATRRRSSSGNRPTARVQM